MSSRFSLVLLCFCLIAPSALAQKARIDAGAKYSADLREERRYGAGLVGGGVLGGIAGAGIEGFAQFGRDWSLGVAIEQAEADFKESVHTSSAQVSVDATTLFSQARWFLGNSFYLKAALGYRVLSINIQAWEDNSSSKVNAAFEYLSILGGVGLGNMWTLSSGLYLGAEWLGYYAPLSSSQNYSHSSMHNLSSRVQADVEKVIDDGKKKFAQVPTIHNLLLTVGYMF